MALVLIALVSLLLLAAAVFCFREERKSLARGRTTLFAFGLVGVTASTVVLFVLLTHRPILPGLEQFRSM
jgi:hypothetical protein